MLREPAAPVQQFRALHWSRLPLSLGAANGERVISAGNQAAAGGADKFEQAYKGLRQDPSVQFNLTPPKPQSEPPEWLKALGRWLRDHVFEPIGRFLSWLGSFLPDAPYARIILWTVIAIAVLALAWAVYNRLRHGKWRLKLPRLARVSDIIPEEEWTPEEAPARSWLEEADALAREGRFAEAVHHLLFRSIEDIAKRRPNLVRPALTSREIGAAEAIPSRARELFAAIARMVERSLFGGRPVREKDWLEARGAYSDLALAGAWRK